MSEVIVANQNDVTVYADGSAFISQRKTAKLCGVVLRAIQHQIKIGLVRQENLNDNNQLDVESLTLLVTHYARQNRAQAIETLAAFAKAGAKAYVYHEAGYEFQATRRDGDTDLAKQLAEAQKKLAYCSIHQDSPKATFALRSNAKVNDVKEMWIELGYLTKRTIMKPVTEYGITPDGSEFLYYGDKAIRVKPEAKQNLKLITQGFSIGRYGQTDLFINI